MIMNSTIPTKACRECGAVKLLSGFYEMASCRDGFRPVCRACCNKRQREKHKDPAIAARRRAATALWTKEHKQKSQASHENSRLKRTYGISLEEYSRMLSEQNGVCAICRLTCTSGRLCIDHRHNTGRVRGLLCRTCNSAIGLLDDSTELIVAALKYLGGA